MQPPKQLVGLAGVQVGVVQEHRSREPSFLQRFRPVQQLGDDGMTWVELLGEVAGVGCGGDVLGEAVVQEGQVAAARDERADRREVRDDVFFRPSVLVAARPLTDGRRQRNVGAEPGAAEMFDQCRAVAFECLRCGTGRPDEREVRLVELELVARQRTFAVLFEDDRGDGGQQRHGDQLEQVGLADLEEKPVGQILIAEPVLGEPAQPIVVERQKLVSHGAGALQRTESPSFGRPRGEQDAIGVFGGPGGKGVHDLGAGVAVGDLVQCVDQQQPAAAVHPAGEDC
nr:hypothetical protein [Lentzea aerocolonigenes]